MNNILSYKGIITTKKSQTAERTHWIKDKLVISTEDPFHITEIPERLSVPEELVTELSV
jgi:hypothetical protein